MKTLLEMSNELIGRGFDDLFNYQVEGEILFLNKMVGSHGNENEIVEFKIIEIGTDTDSNGFLTHLDTIVEEI